MAAFFIDTATVAAKIAITAHTTDSGHTWAKFTGGLSVPNIYPVQGGVITAGGSGHVGWRPSVIAPGADVSVLQSWHVDGSVAAEVFGAVARVSVTGTAGYAGFYSKLQRRWVIFKITGADMAGEVLASGPEKTYANSTPVTCELRVTGEGATVTIELDVDGVTLLTATDTTGTRVVTAGYVGFWIGSSADGGGAWLKETSASLLGAVAATALTLTGPSTAVVGSASSPFTVSANGTLASAVTVTPSDSGGGGSFTPASLAFGPATTTGTFTYAPASGGTKTIGVTNTGGLTNPLAVSVASTDGSANALTLTGPSSGSVGVASTAFTVSANGTLASSVTVTPSAAGGTFTPATVTLTPGSTTGAFTFTPTTSGSKSITLENTGGLANPAALPYSATADPVTVNAPFPPVVADRVKGTASAASGTSITLDAAVPTGFRSFSASFAVGTKAIQAMCEDTAGNWMCVSCTLTNATTLTVESIISSSVPGPTAPTFSAGVKTVFCTMPAKLAFKARTLDLSNYAVYPDFSLDSTAGVQQAILDAHERRIEKIIAPTGHFKMAGPLVGSGNCQVYVPNTREANANRSIWIDGASPPNYEVQGLWAVNPPRNGTLFESTIAGTGTRAAVFGAEQGVAQDVGGWTFTNVSMTNLGIRVKADNATAHKMSAINLRHVNQVPVLDNLLLGVNIPLNSITNPTGGGSYGLILPPVQNHAWFNIGIIDISGYENGISCSEHTYIDHARFVGCVNGLVLEAANHASRFNMLTMEHVKNSIVVNGHHPVSIGLYETEHNGTIAWCAHAYDVLHNSGDRLIAYLRTSIVVSGPGNVGDTAHSEFHSNNPAIYKIFAGPGSA